LVPPLAARGNGIGEIELAFEVKHGRPTRIVIRPSRPEVDPQALFELARATVEGAFRTPESREDFGSVSKLRLTATSLVPIEHTGEKLAFAVEMRPCSRSTSPSRASAVDSAAIASSRPRATKTHARMAAACSAR
jgi:hypothetical protein